jgi:enoyl-CoA hydratase
METIKFEISDGIGVLTFAREKVLNALNKTLLEEGTSLLQEQAGNPDLRVLVLTGAGEKSFVAGADIGELREGAPAKGRELAHFGQQFMDLIDQFPVPVIAAVNGFALGGGLEVALACDFRYASTNARLGLPEVSLGLIPGYGGTQRLFRLIGEGLAKELIFSGDMVSAQDACEIGLVNKVFEPDQLMIHVLKIASTIAGRGPLAVQSAKRAINLGRNLDLASGLVVEACEFSRICSSSDMKEGTSAFLEKRTPSFQGE